MKKLTDIVTKNNLQLNLTYDIQIREYYPYTTATDEFHINIYINFNRDPNFEVTYSILICENDDQIDIESYDDLSDFFLELIRKPVEKFAFNQKSIYDKTHAKEINRLKKKQDKLNAKKAKLDKLEELPAVKEYIKLLNS